MLGAIALLERKLSDAGRDDLTSLGSRESIVYVAAVLSSVTVGGALIGEPPATPGGLALRRVRPFDRAHGHVRRIRVVRRRSPNRGRSRGPGWRRPSPIASSSRGSCSSRSSSCSRRAGSPLRAVAVARLGFGDREQRRTRPQAGLERGARWAVCGLSNPIAPARGADGTGCRATRRFAHCERRRWQSRWVGSFFRYRASRGLERQQLRWLVLAASRCRRSLPQPGWRRSRATNSCSRLSRAR